MTPQYHIIQLYFSRLGGTEGNPHHHPYPPQPSLDSVVQVREKTPQPPPKEGLLQYSPFCSSGHLYFSHPPPMFLSSRHLGSHWQRTSAHPQCRDRHHWVPTSQHSFSVVQQLSFMLSAIRCGAAPQWRKSLFIRSPVRSELTPPAATAKPAGVFSNPQLPRRGQSHLDPRWSRRLTLPPSFPGVDLNPVTSVCDTRYWPFLTSTDYPGGRN